MKVFNQLLSMIRVFFHYNYSGVDNSFIEPDAF